METNKQIKVLFFIETLTGGGAEKVLCNLVNHMDQARFCVAVQTVWPCDANKYLVKGIQYKSVYSSRSRVNRLRYRLEAELGLVYCFHVKDNYDVECAYLEMGPTKVLAASTNEHAKKLAWVHCDLAKAVKDASAYSKKTSPWYKKFDQIVCVSDSVKESFDKLFQGQYSTSVLYNVVDDDEIIKKSQTSLPQGVRKQRFTVLSVGRMSPPKNFMRLLKTHKRLLDDGIDHELWILGEGDERLILEQYVEDYHLQDSVWMPGFVDNPYPYIREADLLACSSLFEGYSTFATEGIILGKPIVTTDVSGMRELLGNSEFGMIVDDGDEAFYQGMKQMITDNKLRKRFEERASVRAESFSALRQTKRTEDFLNLLVGE